MMKEAGSSDDPAATGNAARTAGPSSGYAGRIKARIKPNIVLASSLDGNPAATVEVRVAPDGTIVGRKLVKSSGSSLWDETVLRAIDKTEVLPKDVDGRVPPTIEIAFRPRD
jgi:colicin import membrane protein